MARKCPICNDDWGYGWVWSYTKNKLIACPNCNPNKRKKKD